MVSIKELAILSHAVYDDNEVDLPENWSVEGKIIKVSSLFIEFQAAVYLKNSGERIISFCGSNDATDWVVDNRCILNGVVPPQAYLAMKFFELFASGRIEAKKDVFDTFKVSFVGDCLNRKVDTFTANTMMTGHSLGGALASIVVNKYGVKAVIFNSPGIIGLKNKTDSEFEGGEDVVYIRDLVKHEGEERARKQLTVDQNHMLDVIKAYEQGLFEIKKSDMADKTISHYYINADPAANFRTISLLGKLYCAKFSFDIDKGCLDPHTISQWSKAERYDESGNYDPEKEINKIEKEDKDEDEEKRETPPIHIADY